MSFIESLNVSIFSISLVFLVLAFLFVMVRILSIVLNIKIDKKATNLITEDVAKTADTAETGFSTGELKLVDVDERTAAMIMAIVSDESGIPLAELRFKLIRALDSEVAE